MTKNNRPYVNEDTLQSAEGCLSIDSEEWLGWLTGNNQFHYSDPNGHFMAQRETRRGKLYWYAYRRQNGKLAKVYLGKAEELTPARLKEACQELAGGPSRPPSAPLARPVLPDAVNRIDTNILSITKINGPLPPAHSILRPRLTNQIRTPVTLVVAPSGFGKSTLLNEWKQSCGFAVAWLSLDEQDNPTQHFWYSIVLAIRAVCPGIGKEFQSGLKIGQAGSLQEAILRLGKEIAGSVPHLGVILDDFQHIHSSEIFDTLQFWLDHFPPNLQLVISGHTRPPLSLGHLRTAGLLTELDANSLRFSLEEGIRFLRNSPLEAPLEFEDLKKLVNHNEGWAAGLTLTAMALSSQKNYRQFIDTFSGSHIFFREFFLQTVLQHTSPNVQMFLLKTSILKHLTGSLCDALTGQNDGAEILARLRDNNIFIVRLEQQGWYRYHNLFAEMLYNQLHMRFPQEIPQLHKHAAQWFREHYAPADAIYHLLAMEAWEESATLMEDMALHELEQYGEDSRLLRWLQELPADITKKHKTLLLVYLRLAMIAFPKEKTAQILAQVRTNLTVLPGHPLSADEQEVLAEIQDIEQIWAHSTAQGLLTQKENRADRRWDLLIQLQIVNTNYYPNTKEAEHQLAELVQKAQAQRNLYVALIAGGGWAERLYLNGQLRRSKKIANQALEFASARRGSLPETASIALAALCQVYLEQNDLGMAQNTLDQMLEVDPNPGNPHIPILSGLLRARLQTSLGHPDAARSTLHALQELHLRHPSAVWNNQDLVAFEALACVRMGDAAAAEQLLQGVAQEVDNPGVAQLALAELHLLKNQPEEAEVRLNWLISQSADGMRIEPLMYARVLLALVLFRQKNISQARQVMVEALRLAGPEKFFRPFVLRGAELMQLYRLVLQPQNLPAEIQEFTHQLLILAGCDDTGASGYADELDALSISASISPREQEVLQSISSGLSNRKIAERLSISESTVKTHLSNLYNKLQVGNRLQAITRAKQLNLI